MTELSTRRAQTKATLMSAAKQVFATQGVDVSVEEISEAANFTRGAFYSNFASKTELCVELIKQLQQRDLEVLRRVVPQALESSTGIDDAIDLAVTNFMDLWAGDAETLMALHNIRLAATRNDELREAVLAAQEFMMAELRTVFGLALNKQGVRLAVPVELLLLILRSVCLETVLDGQLGSGFDLDRLKKSLASVIKALVRPVGSSPPPEPEFATRTGLTE